MIFDSTTNGKESMSGNFSLHTLFFKTFPHEMIILRKPGHYFILLNYVSEWFFSLITSIDDTTFDIYNLSKYKLKKKLD